MKIRTDIAALLREGLSDRAVARQTRAASTTVARHRAALGIPKTLPGHFTDSTPQSLFHARTEPVNGGHMRWTGWTTNHGTPAVQWDGRHLTAYRIAFVIRWGRAPEGPVRPGCDMPGCVAPDHVEDQQQRNQYTAIFGEVTP
ncbi:hypothetical protein ACFWM0_14830 [Streptomyces sp. NPDC058405]|uniref:hypothetical protein n=1 Tax=Streptomyces sp. NPDC058405 TaxID=3346482 RepID=UPI003655FB71